MTTDLVRRLRGDALSQEQLWTLRDAAADRIEQLEAGNREFAFLRNDDLARIKELEAALREICDGPRDVDKSYPELLAEVRFAARAALEGKDD